MLDVIVAVAVAGAAAEQSVVVRRGWVRVCVAGAVGRDRQMQTEASWEQADGRARAGSGAALEEGDAVWVLGCVCDAVSLGSANAKLDRGALLGRRYLYYVFDQRIEYTIINHPPRFPYPIALTVPLPVPLSCKPQSRNPLHRAHRVRFPRSLGPALRSDISTRRARF